MKRSQLMLTLAAIMTFGLASFTVAHMMGGNNGQSSAATGNSSFQAGSMGMGTGMMGMTGQAAQSDSLWNNMSPYCTMLSSDFDKLEAHFNRMMQIKDSDKLRVEMQKHHDMMTEMHNVINQRQGMYRNMMSAMHSGGMSGMMGTGQYGPMSPGESSNNR